MQKSINSLSNSDQHRILSTHYPTRINAELAQLSNQLRSTQNCFNSVANSDQRRGLSTQYPTRINAEVYQLTIQFGSTQKSINSNEIEKIVPRPDPNRHWIRVNLKRSVICRDRKHKWRLNVKIGMKLR